ncbi:hypothetical protein [Cellulomonas sp. RIT-PI-Y]|uniref:ATP-binding protein n=1 Tax=Cellulomonas sp. RIT-PI-Y TaxID=3035297 RepID=UPI0021D852F2|nr:hypothetical protein [Cellulomonas sp. RIT-PI-Y]
MVDRLRLVHLTVVGAAVAPATIEFGDHLTVVHGASDTGKSHVFDLIHYVCGLAKAIELPPEGKGYQYVHLGVRTESGMAVTLVRDISGGSIGVVHGDLRQLTTDPIERTLEPRHVSANPDSVSRYLLSLVGMDELVVRKNQYNETRILQWRDVMHLTAVGEESILSKRSPIEFGQHSDRPVESAIFRLFIEGRDDSGLVAIPKEADLKQISANQLEVLDRLVTRLEDELKNAAPLDQLRDQLTRLNVTMRQAGQDVEELSATRDQLVDERSAVRERLVTFRARRDELADLHARFKLLNAQYDSDLSRLEMVAQAADVLARDDGADCPFCGAEPTHQHWPSVDFATTDEVTFSAAIESEMTKIEILRGDLRQAIDAIESERVSTEAEVAAGEDRTVELKREISRLDGAMRGPRAELAPLMDSRAHVERLIETHARLSDLLVFRASVARVERPKTSAEVPISSSDLRMFDGLAREVLRLWTFSEDSVVNYSTRDRDLVVDQRLRRTRGKGVRSILHALFNVVLAQYCLERNYRHPGFLILDSPIVTYRQPGEPEPGGEDETIGSNVVDAFYSYLQDGFSGQSIILENKSPLSPLPPGSQEYFFGGQTGESKRSGFYPTAD